MRIYVILLDILQASGLKQVNTRLYWLVRPQQRSGKKELIWLKQLLVGSSLIEKVSCYKLLGVHLSDNLTWNEHVTHIVKKGSKRLYAIRALKKCGLTDRQLILVYCSIIRSVLEYACPAWAGRTQYLSDQIESIQKRALKVIFLVWAMTRSRNQA